MKPIQTTEQKKAFRLILGLAKSLRGFQDDATFCENVTYTQFAILDYVVEAGGTMPLSDLHQKLNVEKSTTTRLMAPLLKVQLLNKERSESDGRAFDLTITNEGHRIHGIVWECMAGHLGKMLEHLPQSEMQTVMRSLDIFGKALENCCKE